MKIFSICHQTPVAKIELRKSLRVFEKIWNGPNGSVGETDSWKNLEANNLVTLSLLVKKYIFQSIRSQYIRKHVRSVKFSNLPVLVASQITKFRLTQGFDNWGNSCVSVGQSYRMSRIDRGGLPSMPDCSVQCWFAWEKILRKNWNICCTRTSLTFLMP